MIEIHARVILKFANQNDLLFGIDRLDHPESTMM